VILPEPGDGVAQLLEDFGLRDHDGLWTDAARTIGVARSPAGLFIGWLDVGWITPHDAFSEMRDIAHIVESAPRDVLVRDLAFAIEEARSARAERLRLCQDCDERFLPGQMFAAARCHCCAARTGEVRI
jgi:hypothetical protein